MPVCVLVTVCGQALGNRGLSLVPYQWVWGLVTVCGQALGNRGLSLVPYQWVWGLVTVCGQALGNRGLSLVPYQWVWGLVTVCGQALGNRGLSLVPYQWVWGLVTGRLLVVGNQGHGVGDQGLGSVLHLPLVRSWRRLQDPEALGCSRAHIAIASSIHSNAGATTIVAVALQILLMWGVSAGAFAL